jgi:hypothetical protein
VHLDAVSAPRAVIETVKRAAGGRHFQGDPELHGATHR